jgi:hypothetical protein
VTALAAHRGALSLAGLTSLGDDAAEALAARKGRVSLTGLTALSPKAAAALRANAGIELPACQR